ncbi:MAG: hypothetical protein R3B07_04430 [Polyangiaceae bacterium]
MFEGRPTNQRPDTLTVDRLPDWARRAVGPMDEETGKRYGWYEHLGLRGCLGPLAAVPYLLGIGLLFWGLFALRAEELIVWRFALGSVFVLVGGPLAVSGLRRYHGRGNGLLLAPEGVIVVADGKYRVVGREQLQDVRFERGCMYFVYGPERRTWVQYTGPEAGEGARMMDARFQEIARWLKEGTRPPNNPLPKLSAPPSASPLRAGLVGLGIAAGISGFLWLTVVHPATSDAGRVTRGFVGALANKQYDEAYAMLSTERRQRTSRAQFERELPAKLRESTGITINSISGGIGEAVGGGACVDGWLDGVEGYSGYAFELSEDGDQAVVSDWREGTCKRRQ